MTLHSQDISTLELQQIGGGDWYETTWGILLGTGFAAGFLGSGGLLTIAGIAGLGLIFGPPF